MGKHHQNLLNNLEELRKAAGLTQQELSESAEVSRKSINAIENGIYVPSTVLALKIAKRLGCKVEDLFNLNFFSLPSNAMFIPGVLIILGSGYLCASYYFGDKKMNNILYDEYSALRYYKLGAIGFGLNGFGIFVIFSIQDWSNWDLSLIHISEPTRPY